VSTLRLPITSSRQAQVPHQAIQPATISMMQKSTSSNTSTAAALLDETVTYTYRIENTGTITLTGISANDDKLAPSPASARPSCRRVHHRHADPRRHHDRLARTAGQRRCRDGHGHGRPDRDRHGKCFGRSARIQPDGQHCRHRSGTVAKTPDLVKYQHGDVVTLTATPAPGSSFTDWSGDVTGTTNPITITMDGDKDSDGDLYADRVQCDAHHRWHGHRHAAKDPDQATYHYGDVITFTATAGTGSSFAGWSGDATGIASPVTLTVDSDEAVTATFTLIEYTLATPIVGGGTVARQPDQSTYHLGDVVTLTATANPIWAFDGWSGDVNSTANPLVITMDGNKSITATFKQYQIYLPFITKSN